MSDETTPNYIKLFGELDFREGDEARSVYSPAAYLTDLLQLTDDEIDADTEHEFKERRKDIQALLLNSENTFDTLPYLDIVNELLEAKIAGVNPPESAYETLKAAPYPFNLPFDLEDERIKLYLKYLSVSAAELHKGISTNYDKALVAREYLGLASTEETILTTSAAGAELNQRYGDLMSGIGGAVPISVETFLTATALTHVELTELIKQNLAENELTADLHQNFYINAELDGMVEFDTDETHLVWKGTSPTIPEPWFDRALRFIRLAKNIGLTFTELDLILRKCCQSKIDAQALQHIAVVKSIQAKYELSVDETCALFNSPNNMGYGYHKEEPADLFNRVFNGPCAEIEKKFVGINETIPTQYEEYEHLVFSGDILALKNKDYRNRITHALGLSEKQLTLLIKGFRARVNQDIEDEELHDKLWDHADDEPELLHTLYRTKKLAGILELNFEDLFMLLDVLEKDPLVRDANQSLALIDFNISNRNSYEILRSGEPADALWLVQVLSGLTSTVGLKDLTPEQLLFITSGDSPRILDKSGSLKTEAEERRKETARTEKITLLNKINQQIKPLLLDAKAYVSGEIDERFSRRIHAVISERTDSLVAKTDPRLVQFESKAMEAAAFEALYTADRITRDDFLGLGVEDRIAQKIHTNLMLMGYLSMEGVLMDERFPEDPEDFSMETDFSPIKKAVFDIIAEQHKNFVDVGIFISTFEQLNLPKNELEELYDNLIFNGVLSDDGTLLESERFEDSENMDSFDIYTAIDNYAPEVHEYISMNVEKFTAGKIKVTGQLFGDLPLSESETNDLMENLVFNGYLNAEGQLLDNTKLLDMTKKDLRLAVDFYPHTQEILEILQKHINLQKLKSHTFSIQSFSEIAGNLAADWVYEMLKEMYLQEGMLLESEKAFFMDAKNAEIMDDIWSFSQAENQIIFKRIQAGLQFSDSLIFNKKSLEDIDFNTEEIYNLVNLLQYSGDLTQDYKLPRERIAYFLNKNNAYDFFLPGFEDYTKDVFFMLHNVAVKMNDLSQEIIARHRQIGEEQDQALFNTLAQSFGLKADALQQLSAGIFSGSKSVREAWLVPILSMVNVNDEILSEPANSRLNSAFRRIFQFSSLANKLKLEKDDIQILLRDQELVEKFPEHIELPEITLENGEKQSITGFDALLESNDGQIYLFKNPKAGVPEDYARYWIYSSVTHEQVVTEDDKLSTLLSGDEEIAVQVSRVDAAFVDKNGDDVLIIDEKYFVRKPLENWRVREREWGKFDDLSNELNRVEAAFTDESGRSYLFAEDRYVRYSESTEFIDSGYPEKLMEGWKNEGPHAQLPPEFHSGPDAAFYGIDHKTHYFMDESYVSSDKPQEIQSTSRLWGKVKNNLLTSQKVDACYEDAGQIFVISGNQIFAYRDSLENSELNIQEGYPKELKNHFGETLPGEFHSGIDSAFKGTDDKLHLFKDEQTASFLMGDPEAGIQETRDVWGLINNPLTNGLTVDAALSGLDGYVYLFQGETYFRYSGDDYSQVDSGYPRKVSEDWVGLNTIQAAFVLDGKTYVFGMGEVEDEAGVKSVQTAYVRYSTSDYSKADEGYPMAQTETDSVWWNLPESLQADPDFDQVDAIFNAPEGKTYLFAGDSYVYFDDINRWWSEPRKLNEDWQALGSDGIDAAFTGMDGKTYFFSGSNYIRFSKGNYGKADNAYPRPVKEYWGMLQNNITDWGKVDAAVVAESREVEENDDGTTDIKKTMHTYLFSGDQFFRYQGTDYANVEAGYPKSLEDLKEEPRFKELEETLKGVDAAFADRRNVYLFEDGVFHVVSDSTEVAYYLDPDLQALPFQEIESVVMADGALYGEKTGEWQHISAPEGNLVTLTKEMPALLETAPANYTTGLNAVLEGADSNTYLFKGDRFFDMQLNRDYPIRDQWGRISNHIQENQHIDAAFVGTDGKTYVFSGDQYVIYEGETYVGQEVFRDLKNASPVHSVSEDWGGLSCIHAAYVLGDKTYVFEKPYHHGSFRYLCYSNSDYTKPDFEQPRTVDCNFWAMPAQYKHEGWDQFDAIIVENGNLEEQATLLFIKNREFMQYNVAEGHWSRPKSLDKLWNGLRCEHHLFDELETAFVGPDGSAYFFGQHCFVSHMAGVYTDDKPIADNWGILPTAFQDKVDAAFVHENGKTYLFSGNTYTRYSGEDYTMSDVGYPKLISEKLRDEAGFENLPPEFETRVANLNQAADSVIVKGIAANERNIYLFMGDNLYVSSLEQQAMYYVEAISRLENNLVETGLVDAAFVKDGKTYLLSGEQFLRYSERNYEFVDEGYPKRIATGLAAELGSAEIPAEFHWGIHAALLKEGTVYLFKDKQFLDLTSGLVASIKDTWGRVEKQFNAESPDAFFVDSMGRLYLFKENQYIRYADTEQDYVEIGYPKNISSTFKHLPADYQTGINGAFTFAGRTYLVKNDGQGEPEAYVRYPGDDYQVIAGPDVSSSYPVTFTERWGSWSDFRLQDLETITRFKALQSRLGGSPDLMDFLKMDQGAVKEPYAMLADIFGQDSEEIQWLKRHNVFLPLNSNGERRFNLELILRLDQIFALTETMGTYPTNLYQNIWQKLYGTTATAPEAKAEAADALLELLAGRHCDNQDLNVLVTEVHNKLNLIKRDALLPYAIFMDPLIDDARDLYEILLSDVQTGETAETSRIKEAIAAVQLYFNRYFLNLEDADLKNKGGLSVKEHRDLLKERWNWMRNYRVWEANRKVFLYPENYIRPELRDTKTPEFSNLENELLQGEMTEGNITRAFKHYIDQYSEISRLTISGGYVYDSPDTPGDKKIVLFGRTKSEPHRYYYRYATFVGGLSDQVIWEPWIEANVQIDADRVYPVYTLNKVYVFWAKVANRSSAGMNTTSKFKSKDGQNFSAESNAVNQSILEIQYSYFNLNGEWSPPQKLNYEIASNDTITSYFLDLSGARQEIEDNLDNIKIRCTYTTEREVKPEIGDDGTVNVTTLIDSIKASNRKKSQTIYLKGSNGEGSDSYYMEHLYSRHNNQIKIGVNRVVPGDSLRNESRFQVEHIEGKVALHVVNWGRRSNSARLYEGHYLTSLHKPIATAQAFPLKSGKWFTIHTEALNLNTGGAPWLWIHFVSHILAKGVTDNYYSYPNVAYAKYFTFSVTKGLMGDGYSFVPNVDHESILFYDENKQVQIKKWDELTTDSEKRQATFSFIANREDHSNSFRFYPETNNSEELNEGNSGKPLDYQSGIDTFKNLFPAEDHTKVASPILLNVPLDERSLPWVCYDYKGGSFLCKPITGQTDIGDTKTFNYQAQNFGAVSAAFADNLKTYFFSGDKYLEEDQSVLTSETSVNLTALDSKDTWGLVDNLLKEDNLVNAALVRGDQTFLFSGERYVRYSGENYEYVDEGYPRQINSDQGVNDGLPEWDNIDAAFDWDGVSYFINGDTYTIWDGTEFTEHDVFPNLWPATVSMTPDADQIRSVFAHKGQTYAFNDGETLFRTDDTVDFDAHLAARFTQVVNDSNIGQAEKAFAVGSDVYLKGSGPSYFKYSGAITTGIFEYLNPAQNMKAVFINAGLCYILNVDSDGVNPVISIWNLSSTATPTTTISVTNAPGNTVDTFFYNTETLSTYIFSGTEYIKIAGLPTADIDWALVPDADSDSLDEFLLEFGIKDAPAKIDSAFEKYGQLFLTAGNEYIRYSAPEQTDPDLPTPALPDPAVADPDDGYPRLISESNEDNLPVTDSIDAGFQSPIDNEAVYFMGDKFVTSEDFTTEQNVKDSWAIVRNSLQVTGRVDAAFTLNSQVYLISGDQYYLYNVGSKTLEEGYPRTLNGIVDGLASLPQITTAFNLSGKVYFFTDGQTYAEWDPESNNLARGDKDTDLLWPAGFQDFQAAYNYNGEVYLINANKYNHSENPIRHSSSAEYDLIRLSSMTGSKLNQALFIGGVDALMEPKLQEIDELPTFTFENRSGDSVIQVEPDQVNGKNFPVHSHLEFRGANGVYYWEMFYHIPTLIAQALNTSQKFEEAKRWYEYIFDPTEIGDYWKFLPFLAVDITALLSALKPLEEHSADMKTAVDNLADELSDFASPLLGHSAMSDEHRTRFDQLHEWDSGDRIFTTWTQVGDLETELADATGLNAELKASAEEVLEIIKRLPVRYALMVKDGDSQIKSYLDDPFDPHAIASLRRIAYRRAGVMAYIDNLLDWGDRLFRQYTRESINEARMLYVLAYEMLGKKPENLGARVLSEEQPYTYLETRGAGPNTYDFLFDVSTDGETKRSFSHAGIVHESVGNPYFFVPENSYLMAYWERVEDRLHKIRHSLNIMGISQPLPLFQPPIDPMALVNAVSGVGGISAALADFLTPVPHYRFSFMLAQARELASKLSRYGSDLLSVIEKQDAEELSLLQKRQEGIILDMTRDVKEAQINEAEENLKNLLESKIGVEDEKKHYDDLIKEGMIQPEHAQIKLLSQAALVFGLVPALKLAAAVVTAAVPEFKGGSPTTIGLSMGGKALGAALNFAADSGETIGESLQARGEVAGIHGQHKRSEQEWELRRSMAKHELKQLEHQIEGAQWRVKATKEELTVHDKEMEFNESIALFMKEKFSNERLYRWMSSKLAGLYFQTYKLAHELAKSAEKAYQFERGYQAHEVNFIGGDYWDSLHKGLLSGETLGLDLDRMEKTYNETDSRSLEIVRVISLDELDPLAFLRLMETGSCEFHLTEEFFDYDFPGQYRRQIKTIGVQINAGEGEIVYGTLTQLRNKTVLEPDLKAVKYLIKPDDNQPANIRMDWKPGQQMAVSKQHWITDNSHGLFELRYEDSRYLPFEGTGAVSSWRLELKGKQGLYDIKQIADASIELRYYALQGGQDFADGVKGLLKPYPAAVRIDLAERFSNEFFEYIYGSTKELKITVTRDMFPNMSGSKITGVFSHFDAMGDAQVSMVMNDDGALTLRQDKMLLTNALAVGSEGETWTFTVKGDKSKLENASLVFAYKAKVN